LGALRAARSGKVAPPAAIRVESLKTQHPYKTEMDAEARRQLFRHTIEA